MWKFIRDLVWSIRAHFTVEKKLKAVGAWGQPPEHPNCQCSPRTHDPEFQRGVLVASVSFYGAPRSAALFIIDFRRILAGYNRSVLEAKSPAARGKLAAPAFYAILEAARLHGIQPLGTESQGEQGTKERREA